MTDSATLGHEASRADDSRGGDERYTASDALSSVTQRFDRWDRRALLLIAAGVAAWAWLAGGGGLQLDDIRAQAYSADQPFWPFIVQSNKTHLSPGARTVDWLHSAYAPFSWWPAVVLILIVAAALGVVSWLALKAVVGGGRAALVGLFWVMFCPALIPGSAWYRQSLTIGLPIVLMLSAVLLSVAASRRNSWWLAGSAVVVQGLALCFSERAVLIPPVVLVALLLFGNTSHPGSAWRALWKPRPLFVLAGMTITNVAFLLVYRSGDFDDGSAGDPSVSGLLLSTGRSLFLNTLPSLLGGPIVWRRVLGGYSFAATPVWFAVIASGIVVAVLVVALGRRRPGTPTLRLATVGLTYILPLYVLIYVGRISRDKVTSVDDLRLYSDVVIVVAILVAVALGDLRGTRAHRRRLQRISEGLAVVVIILTAISWVGWARPWHSTTSREYFATASSQVRSASGTILPSSFPDSVLPVYYQTDMSTANFVRLVNPAIDTTLASAAPQVLDWTGHVVPATYRLVARAVPPKNFCGFRLPPGVKSLTIGLDKPIPYQRSELVLLRVLAPDTTALNVTVIDADGVEHEMVNPSAPTLYRGPHALAYQVPWQTRVAAIKITPDDGHAGLCVTDAPLVLAVPK